MGNYLYTLLFIIYPILFLLFFPKRFTKREKGVKKVQGGGGGGYSASYFDSMGPNSAAVLGPMGPILGGGGRGRGAN